MKKIAFLLILTLLVLACSSNNILYQDKLQQFVGSNEQNVINSFGRPTKQTILSNGTKILTYTKINDFYMPMEYYEGWLGYEPAGLVYFDDFGMPVYDKVIDTEVQDICQTQFTLQNDKVTSFQFQGNDCH